MAKYGSQGILPNIIYPSTAKAAAEELLSDIEATNLSVQQCAGLNAATRDSWTAYYTTAKAFLLQAPGIFGLGTRMDRIASYGDDLYAWKQELTGKTCDVGPVVDPQAVPPETSQMLNLAHWGLYAIIAVAGAYGVGKVIEILPKPEPGRPSLGARMGGHVGRAKARARAALA